MNELDKLTQTFDDLGIPYKTEKAEPHISVIPTEEDFGSSPICFVFDYQSGEYSHTIPNPFN